MIPQFPYKFKFVSPSCAEHSEFPSCFLVQSVLYYLSTCRCDEMVDVADSKSAAGDSVPVRVRSPAPIRKGRQNASLFLLIIGVGREPISMRLSGGQSLDSGLTESTPYEAQPRQSSPVTGTSKSHSECIIHYGIYSL